MPDGQEKSKEIPDPIAATPNLDQKVAAEIEKLKNPLHDLTRFYDALGTEGADQKNIDSAVRDKLAEIGEARLLAKVIEAKIDFSGIDLSTPKGNSAYEKLSQGMREYVFVQPSSKTPLEAVPVKSLLDRMEAGVTAVVAELKEKSKNLGVTEEEVTEAISKVEPKVGKTIDDWVAMKSETKQAVESYRQKIEGEKMLKEAQEKITALLKECRDQADNEKIQTWHAILIERIDKTETKFKDKAMDTAQKAEPIKAELNTIKSDIARLIELMDKKVSDDKKNEKETALKSLAEGGITSEAAKNKLSELAGEKVPGETGDAEETTETPQAAEPGEKKSWIEYLGEAKAKAGNDKWGDFMRTISTGLISMLVSLSSVPIIGDFLRKHGVVTDDDILNHGDDEQKEVARQRQIPKRELMGRYGLTKKFAEELQVLKIADIRKPPEGLTTFIEQQTEGNKKGFKELQKEIVSKRTSENGEMILGNLIASNRWTKLDQEGKKPPAKGKPAEGVAPTAQEKAGEASADAKPPPAAATPAETPETPTVNPPPQAQTAPPPTQKA